jgi:hypothetical protein
MLVAVEGAAAISAVEAEEGVCAVGVAASSEVALRVTHEGGTLKMAQERWKANFTTGLQLIRS